MTRVLAIIAGTALILLFATLMIVVMPGVQMQTSSRPSEGLKPYSEQAARGRAVYIDLGCVYCHSQQPRDPAVGPDGLRGWGRPSVPGDYSYDSPHLLGTMRTGPDLLNIGARQPSQDWHLGHLYNPRALSPGSIMPAYPFLFTEVSAIAAGQVALKLPEPYIKAGAKIIATQQALDLLAYLKALDRTYKVKAIPVSENKAGTAPPAEAKQ